MKNTGLVQRVVLCCVCGYEQNKEKPGKSSK